MENQTTLNPQHWKIWAFFYPTLPDFPKNSFLNAPSPRPTVLMVAVVLRRKLECSIGEMTLTGKTETQKTVPMPHCPQKANRDWPRIESGPPEWHARLTLLLFLFPPLMPLCLIFELFFSKSVQKIQVTLKSDKNKTGNVRTTQHWVTFTNHCCCKKAVSLTYLPVCARVRACGLAYPACNSGAPQCDIICGLSGSATLFDIIS